MGRRRRSDSSSSSSSEDSEARRLRKERKRLKKEKKKLKKESKKKRRRRSKSPTAAKPVEGPKPPPPAARPSLLAAAMAPLSTGTVAGDRSGSFVGSGWSHGAPKRRAAHGPPARAPRRRERLASAPLALAARKMDPRVTVHAAARPPGPRGRP